MMPPAAPRASLTEAPAGAMEKLSLLDADVAAPTPAAPPKKAGSLLSTAGGALAQPSRAIGGIADALQAHGVCVCNAGAGADAIAAARAEMQHLFDTGGMGSGKMSSVFVAHGSWRQDCIAWLTAAKQAAMPATAALDAKMHALCAALGAELEAREHMKLTGRHDAQLALFPGDGAAFKKHADTKDICGPGRKLTVILYLNAPGWSAGGSLRVYGGGTAGGAAECDAAEGDAFDVAPLGDTMVIMRSDMAHEVMPCHDARAALTIWWDGKLLAKHPVLLAAAAAEGVGKAQQGARAAPQGAEEGGEEAEEAPLAPRTAALSRAPRRRRRFWPFG